MSALQVAASGHWFTFIVRYLHSLQRIVHITPATKIAFNKALFNHLQMYIRFFNDLLIVN